MFQLQALAFLSCLIVGQLPDEYDVNTEKDRIKDYHFIEAQENWVIDSMPPRHPMKGIAPIFGNDVVYIMEGLSCEHYGCRRNAAVLLENMGEDAIRPLVWGARHRNRYVASECQNLLTRFYDCYHCKGTGEWDYGSYTAKCGECEGFGNLRGLR